MVATDLRGRCHPDCIVCGPDRPDGLRLAFVLGPDGVAEARFGCDRRFEGYPGLLHGGVTAALLDGAMTNCLFLHGQAAFTAELVVRFRHPVAVGRAAVLRAWLTDRSPPVFRLRAELVQDGVRKATARGAFMRPRSGADRVRST